MSSREARVTIAPGLSESVLLAAIVESSDDAILTRDLSGIITSWNQGATQLFGYDAEEIVGRPVLTLLPSDRHDEELKILDRIRRGERTDHFETFRRHKDGRLIPISLTVSPLRDENGVIIGASKIARDITERHRAQEMQRLLMGEMQHRIKNVFAMAGALVGLSAARAQTPGELAQMVRARLRALAAAHELTVPSLDGGNLQNRESTLHDLLRVLLEPALGADGCDRLALAGPNLTVAGAGLTPLALVLNELATNAIKYGALRDEVGRISVATSVTPGDVVLIWTEDHPQPTGAVERPEMGRTGFGSTLSRIAVEQQLGGRLSQEWEETGLRVTITLPDRVLTVIGPEVTERPSG